MKGIQLAKSILVYGTLICISFMVPNLSTAKLDPDTLSGIWFFDEGKGGEAKDSSENGNDGEIVDAQWVSVSPQAKLATVWAKLKTEH